ncbi:MAG TPA: hypothetical protein VLI44_02560, partial [Sporolactobacillaceae bacterium]|nr:hypothetical protein [Sporolactobacillaceae bacterium]
DYWNGYLHLHHVALSTRDRGSSFTFAIKRESCRSRAPSNFPEKLAIRAQTARNRIYFNRDNKTVQK